MTVPKSAGGKRHQRRLRQALRRSSPSNTDASNAKRFVEEFGTDLRYCHTTGKWLVWDGYRWQPVHDGHVVNLAKRIHEIIAKEAQRASSESERRASYRWAATSGSEAKIQSMVRLGRSEPLIGIQLDDLDADPLLLGVQNGVVDLETGELLEPQRDQLITKQARVKYDPDATCSRWDQFIEEVTGGDQDLAAYLQKLTGYFLTGLTDEQCLFVLFGGGANGKSKFLDILQDLLGDYARTIPYKALMARRDPGSASPELAQLPGARLVVASEPNAGSRLDEATIKLITGQDRVPCRQLYGQPFEFVPEFKLVLMTNHKPDIRGTDEGIWRRLRLIPFDQSFPPHKRDKKLIDKLRPELSGILNWAIEGVLRYQREGLESPTCVADATAAYRREMDILGQWIEEWCQAEPNAKTPVSSLYGRYRNWCVGNNHRYIGAKTFGNELEQRGFKRGVASGGTRVHCGITLRPKREFWP